MSAPIYLNDLGVVCALGDGRDAVASAMFAGVPGGLSDNDTLLPGHTLALGQVRTPLPTLEELPAALRPNAIALVVIALVVHNDDRDRRVVAGKAPQRLRPTE